MGKREGEMEGLERRKNSEREGGKDGERGREGMKGTRREGKRRQRSCVRDATGEVAKEGKLHVDMGCPSPTSPHPHHPRTLYLPRLGSLAGCREEQGRRGATGKGERTDHY